MSVIGPRPQLVRDMVFMTEEQRMRHTAKPGLSGLAQVNGRNAISWEEKLDWDLKYIRKVSLLEDLKIIVATVKKALIHQDGISQEDMATAEDYGDYLLRSGQISQDEYEKQQKKAKKIMSREIKKTVDEEVAQYSQQGELPKYSALMSLYVKEKPQYLSLAIKSMIDQTWKPDEIVIVKDGKITPELQDVLDFYTENIL